MKKWMFVGILAAALMPQAHAADLSLFAGYINPGSLNLGNVFTNLQMRSGAVYGGRFEVDFHRTIGLEQNIAFMPNLVSSNVLAGSALDVRGFLYHTNLVLNVPMGHMVPFATAGIGLIKPFGPGLRPFGTRFAFNYGGGVKFARLMGPVGLRFDVRGYAVPDVATQTLNMLEVSGGLIVSFGSH